MTCAPEDVATASESSLRENSPTIEVSCGVERKVDRVTREKCMKRIASMSAKLTRRFPSSFVPVDAGAVTLHGAETCLDSFVSGNEASDCGFYDLVATVPMSWRN